MSIFQNHIGVNISSSKLQLVEVLYNGDDFVLENVDEEYFDEFLRFDQKETRITTLLQNAFNELSMRQTFKSKNISFTLPHEFFKTVMLPFDNTLTSHDLTEQFKWELSMLYPETSSEELVIQHIQVEDCRNAAPDNAIIIGLYRKYLRILKNFSDQNNLTLKYVDNLHIASDRLITLDESISENELVLSVYVAGNLMSVSFLYNYNPVYFRVIHIEQAGEILSRLTHELASIKNPDLDQKFITKAFISGDNIPDSLIEKAGVSLKMPFHRPNPFEKIRINPDLFSRKIITEKPYSFSPAAAIAYRVV
ncbi:MAG: hypothetical protein ACM3SM_02035 [Bacteroidota bacterium]